ncbi:hypothetical protein [Aquisphaera insulae]|uniref:hypothetical protein n=1 Tax=Aquisphaera insulae TaxID=2712864 RepID=UPI0013ECF741|nr:hypothetical protein [Aquisphaera insulae]
MRKPRGHRRRTPFVPSIELEPRCLLSLSVSCLGTVGADLVGPSVSVGFDGIQDIDLRLSGLSGSSPIASIRVQDGAGLRWEYDSSGTPQGGAHAEFFAATDDPTRGDLYISPVVNAYQGGGATGPPRTIANGDLLALTVEYADGTIGSAQACAVSGLASPLAVVGSSSPVATIVTTPDPTAVTVSWSNFANNGQDGSSWQPGAVHLLAGNLQGRKIATATLSDIAGSAWMSTNQDHMYLSVAQAADDRTADLYFVPTRDETVGPASVSAATDMTLRITFADDPTTQYVTRFAGGPWRTDLVAAGLSGGGAEATAVPVSDEATLASRLLHETGDDTITLAPNSTIIVTRPLVIGHSVRIVGQGATLLFRPSWSADVPGAISLDPNARWADVFRIDLEDFRIAFDDSAAGTWYDPEADDQGSHAVINLMNSGQTTVRLSLDGMSIEGPAARDPAPPTAGTLPVGATYVGEPTPHLIFAQQAYGWTQESGSIVDSTFRGGTIALGGGPWQITGNTVLGAPAGTFSLAAFSFQSPHDVTLANNRVSQDAAGGYLARFINVHGSSYNDLITGNTFIGGLPATPYTFSTTRNVFTDINAPEVILVENYGVYYEGTPAGIASEGYVLTLRTPSTSVPFRGDAPGPGAVVSILSTTDAGEAANPYAGTWYRIAQVISTSPPTYLMETPLPAGSYEIAVTAGSVGDVYSGNTIDLSGYPSHGIDLVGNQFGTQVVHNTFLGDGEDPSRGLGRGIEIAAYNSEGQGQGDPSNPFPLPYGWTPLPMLDITVESNTIVNLPATLIVAIQHGNLTNTSSGRVYLTATVEDNTIRWSQAWLDRWKGVFQSITNDNNNLSNSPDDSWIPPSITIGSGFSANYRIPGTVDGPSGEPNGPLGFIDPHELQVVVRGNSATIVKSNAEVDPLAAASGQVFAAIVNGVAAPSNAYPYNKPSYFQFGNSTWCNGEYFYAPFNAANLDIAATPTSGGATPGGSTGPDSGNGGDDGGGSPGSVGGNISTTTTGSPTSGDGSTTISHGTSAAVGGTSISSTGASANSASQHQPARKRRKTATARTRKRLHFNASSQSSRRHAMLTRRRAILAAVAERRSAGLIASVPPGRSKLEWKKGRQVGSMETSRKTAPSAANLSGVGS